MTIRLAAITSCTCSYISSECEALAMQLPETILIDIHIVLGLLEGQLQTEMGDDEARGHSSTDLVCKICIQKVCFLALAISTAFF